MAWGLLSGCACKSVGVAKEARDHSYFRTQSVVSKVHPLRKKIAAVAAYSVVSDSAVSSRTYMAKHLQYLAGAVLT